MAPLVVPDGFATAKFRYALTGDPEEMISTLGVDLGNNDPDVLTANAIADQWKEHFCLDGAGLSNQWTFLGVDLQIGNDPPPGVVVRSTTAALVGSGSFPTLPQNCSILVQKRTAQPGRRGRGRMFLPPAHFGEAGVTGAGVIGGAELAATQTRMDDFITELGNDGPLASLALVPVLFHSEAPTAPTVITQMTVAPVIATQRQRLRR